MKWTFVLLLPFLLMACSDAQFESQAAGGPEKTGDGGPPPSLEEGLDNPEMLDDYPCRTGGRENHKKVQVCHVPPGNPENRHTICISKNALAAHLSKHQASTGETDSLGECAPDDEETVTEDPGDDCDLEGEHNHDDDDNGNLNDDV